MAEIGTALLVCLVFWWLGTGAILVAVGFTRRTLGLVMALSLPALAGSIIAFDWAAAEGGLTGVYVGFAAAIAIWGWHEFAFLTGAITGPNREPCPPQAQGWERFRAAVLALAWHELALVGTAAFQAAITWGDISQFGLLTFLVLLVARISAKLNVFFGVPNLSEEFIPDGLAHLKSYFRRRPMNLFFPVSVTGLMLAVSCWAERGVAAETTADIVGYTLLGALTTLALIEHWLLVLPLRDAALWHWMLPERDARRKSLMSTDRAL